MQIDDSLHRYLQWIGSLLSNRIYGRMICTNHKLEMCSSHEALHLIILGVPDRITSSRRDQVPFELPVIV